MQKMSNFVFRQLFDSASCTYSYLLGDTASRSAIFIDPVVEHVERDMILLDELNLKLIYAANTHVHADHITSTSRLKEIFPDCRSVISLASGAKADKLLNPPDVLEVEGIKLEVRPTPGHTNGCVTYVCHEKSMAFTGDAVLYRGCGRTDFQEGDAARLYESVHSQIFSLPDHYLLYPAHDYKGHTVTTVKEEKMFNAPFTKTKEEFIDIMQKLNLAYPKMIEDKNKLCLTLNYTYCRARCVLPESGVNCICVKEGV